jgi:cyclopropane fatty-acyl-phospholipid synthase-like methyltransferase
LDSKEHDDWESHWANYAESASLNPAQSWRREIILGCLRVSGDDRVLDVGSGQGDLAAAIVSAHPQAAVQGLELSASGVSIASQHVPSATFHQVDLLTDGTALPHLIGWANKIVCAEVLEHLDSPKVLLTNALQYASPGARVVVTVPAGPRTAFDKYIGHRRHYTRSSLRELMESVGLAVESVEAAGFPFFNIYRLVVFARGKRLIGDVSSQAGPVDSGAANLVLRAFGRLFGANLRRGALGWQLVAVAETRPS